MNFSWPELQWFPAGDDQSSARSLQPVEAHFCTTWLLAQEHYGLHIARWLKSQPEGSPSLTQHRAGASEWEGLSVCTHSGKIDLFRIGMIHSWTVLNHSWLEINIFSFVWTVFWDLIICIWSWIVQMGHIVFAHHKRWGQCSSDPVLLSCWLCTHIALHLPVLLEATVTSVRLGYDMYIYIM